MLASASPRRRDLLAAAGWVHAVRPADVDESVRPGEAPLACCERLARDKARAAVDRLDGTPAGGVLAGDTIVEVDGRVLGKPADRAEAEVMLRDLSGRVHRVASSVALLEVATGEIVSGTAVSEVRFDALDDAVLSAYLDGQEWAGKAGAYAIQGDAGAFAHLVSGALDTVIGLPMGLVETLADAFGDDR